MVSAGSSPTQIGLVSAKGTVGTYTYTGSANEADTIGNASSDPTQLNLSGTFSVASNGRLTTTVSHGQVPVIYLVNAGFGFYLSGDTFTGCGYIESQTGSTFPNSSASGIYEEGGIDPEVSTVTDDSGDANAAPATTTLSGISDKNVQGTLTPDNAFSGTYSIDSTGLGLAPSGYTLMGASANCSKLFVVISPKKAVAMSVAPSDTAPKLQILQQ